MFSAANEIMEWLGNVAASVATQVGRLSTACQYPAHGVSLPVGPCSVVDHAFRIARHAAVS